MTQARHPERETPTAETWQSPPRGRSALRPRRPRIVDEERRVLREVEATFAGADVKRADADSLGVLPWDHEPDHEPDDGSAAARPSRLFRE